MEQRLNYQNEKIMKLEERQEKQHAENKSQLKEIDTKIDLSVKERDASFATIKAKIDSNHQDVTDQLNELLRLLSFLKGIMKAITILGAIIIFVVTVFGKLYK